jgi:hypothetical protein
VLQTGVIIAVVVCVCELGLHRMLAHLHEYLSGISIALIAVITATVVDKPL